MAGFLNVLRDLVLLITRIAFGALLVMRGWLRWTGDGGMKAQTDYLAQFGTPQPELFAWGATLLEMIGGLFLIFGLLTPVVALALVVEFVLVISYTKYFNGPLGPNGMEHAGVQACLAALLTVFGAGRASIDQLFKRPKDTDDEYADIPATPAASTSKTKPIKDSDPA